MGPLDPRFLNLIEYRLRCAFHWPWYARLRIFRMTVPFGFTPFLRAPRMTDRCALLADARRLPRWPLNNRWSVAAAFLYWVAIAFAVGPGRLLFRPLVFLFMLILRYAIIFSLKCTKELTDGLKWSSE